MNQFSLPNEADGLLLKKCYLGGFIMCGCYTITITEDELLARYMIEEPTDRYHTPRYNVAPTQKVPVILNDDGILRLDAFRWGLGNCLISLF